VSSNPYTPRFIFSPSLSTPEHRNTNLSAQHDASPRYRSLNSLGSSLGSSQRVTATQLWRTHATLARRVLEVTPLLCTLRIPEISPGSHLPLELDQKKNFHGRVMSCCVDSCRPSFQRRVDGAKLVPLGGLQKRQSR
jgi:hypothetical protein